MVAAAFQLRPTGVAHDAHSIAVLCGGTVIGHIAHDDGAKTYRYFPGADNDVAFVFEHPSLSMLLRWIKTRSWEEELGRIGRR